MLVLFFFSAFRRIFQTSSINKIWIRPKVRNMFKFENAYKCIYQFFNLSNFMLIIFISNLNSVFYFYIFYCRFELFLDFLNLVHCFMLSIQLLFYLFIYCTTGLFYLFIKIQVLFFCLFQNHCKLCRYMTVIYKYKYSHL